MDPLGEEQLDYGDEDYGGGGGDGGGEPQQYPGAIPALADDDEYDDLYDDVNVGESFMQTHQQQQPSSTLGNGKSTEATTQLGSKISEAEQKASAGNYQEGASQRAAADTQVTTAGFQTAPPAPMLPRPTMDPKLASGAPLNRSPGPMMNDGPRPGGAESNGPTTLFVGELQWWTTDADLEGALSRYGRVKEIKFFEERASGKSKGYCQVEFHDAGAAAACKDGMNGHMFNGRACVVAFASPQTLRQMGAATHANRNPPQGQTQPPGRRMTNDGMSRGGGSGVNFQGRGANWVRGGQGMLNRGQGGGGMMRGRGNMGGRNMGGAGAGAAPGPFGQGLVGPALGGPAGGLMHPQGMMGAMGFDPMFMGRGGPFGGFSAPAFPGMMPPFPPVNTVGLPGVAPHVNPAFFGRGMSANGMGMMDGQLAGMWTDPSMGGWTAEEQGRRTRESSYGGDDGASDHGYGEVNHEKGGRSNASREKERGSERDWSGNSERRYHDEGEQDWERSDRDRYREAKDGYRDNRQRDRDRDNGDDWQHSSRSGSKSRMMREEDHSLRSRDSDYGKRRRLSSD